MKKLVIKISEKAYNALTHTEFDANLVVNEMRKAIVNGKPLPEHHGRLIDADKFHEVIENIPIKDTDKWFNRMQKTCNRLADAPTIIEGSDTE